MQGAKGWGASWYRPGGVNPTANSTTSHLLLGGEVSMWSDDYCFPLECSAWTNRFPPSEHKLANASCLWNRSHDEAFARSIGGVVWPRGIVAAGAFWGYDYAKTGPAFANTIDAITMRLQHQGSWVCSAGCACDYLSECGVRYDGLPREQANGCFGGYSRSK